MRKFFLIILACLGLLTLIFVDRWQTSQWQFEKSAELDAVISISRIRIENSFANRFHALESLSSLFISRPDTNAEEFAHFASSLLKFHAPIRAIQYADRFTRVIYVYPAKGNEITIKKPMVLLSDPKRAPFTKKAIQNKTAVLQGPFKLRQGGTGIVLRFPIFKQNEFLGLSIGVYNFEDLISEALQGLDLSKFCLSLKTNEGKVFWSSGNVPDNSPELNANIADTSWVLSINWTQKPIPPFFSRILVWLFGSGFIALSICLILFLRKQEVRLEAVVEKRTVELSNVNKALQESEERLDLALQFVNDGIFDWNLETNDIYYSPSWKFILGYSDDELPNDYSVWEELTDPGDVKRSWKMQTELINGKRDRFEMEFRMKHKDGHWVNILSRAKAVFDGKGKAVRIVGTHVDISNRKAIEEALRESEQKFKRLFEQAPLSYQSLDETGNFTEVNQTWLKTMGYRSDEVLGKNFSEFLASEWKVHFEENFPRFKAVGEVLGVEFEMVKKDGSHILVSFHGKISRGESGNFKRTHCVFNDISRQKAAEDTLKKDVELHRAIAEISKELLSESYDMKKVSGETLKAAKYLTRSEHGFVSSIDQKTLDNVGHTLTEMYGEACRIKDRKTTFPLGENGKYGGLWGHALNTKKGFFTNAPDTHPSSTGMPPGHILMKNFMALPVLIGNRLLGLIALSNSEGEYSNKDIDSVSRIAEIYALAIHRQEYESERIKMEQNLRQLQKNEAIGSLAGGIAHDFNNILFPILGFAEMLEEEIGEDSPLREGINEILTASKRAKELVKQILTFSRQTEQEIKPLKPHLVIKEVVKLMKSTLPKTIEIKQSIDPKCRTILADPTQIHQIAMNLVTNSYHAMESSGGVLSITLKNIDYNDHLKQLGLYAGPHILLSIEDTGTGMDKSTIEKIFDPYFSTKPQGKGTGLGLSVVQGIINTYGGKITIDSILGKGSIFNIYLPAVKSTESLKATFEKVSAPQGSESILLVDDEEPILNIERQMLERLGYEVYSTTDSEEALDQIRLNPEKYDLLITDMTMPKMTGDVLAQEVKQLNPELPVVICTGFSEKLTPERASNMGVEKILIKPVIKAQMAKTIRKVLD